MVQPMRTASWRRIVMVCAAMLVVASLAPVALAQEEPVATEEPTGADLNPTDDSSGRNSLNPIADGGVGNLNPMVRPPAEEPPADTAKTDEDAPPAEPEPDPPEAETPAAEGQDGTTADETTSAQGAIQPNRANQRARAGEQPVEAAHPAAGGEPVSAGDAGTGDATGSGGTIIQSAAITGNNRGSEINVNDCAYGSVQIDGGTIINATDVSLSADGGTAVSTANGGDDNVVRAGGAVASRTISAGNGGSADAGADGGTIITGAMITGNNRGHEVNFADCPNGRGDAVLIVDAGDISNNTTIDISADGGTAITDAGGGSGNAGITGGLGDAAAGNGGSADASADGGTIITSAMITGNNRGNTINVGEEPGPGAAAGRGTSAGGTAYACLGGTVTVIIDGGNIANSTTIEISADGGTAITDAGGGNDNLGLGRVGAVGSGGSADASADGGTIITNPILTGNNRGNSISVGNVSGCAPIPAPAPTGGPGPAVPKDQAGPKPVAPKQIATGNRGSTVAVRSLPDTGTGPVAGAIAAPIALLATAALALTLSFVSTGWRMLGAARLISTEAGSGSLRRSRVSRL